MDYITKFKELGFSENPNYPQNDIGIARLFYDLHSDRLKFVAEANGWYAYDGRKWSKNLGRFRAAELCKDFTQAFSEYAKTSHADDPDFTKYATKLTSRRNREGILMDAQSINPASVSEFDKDKLLLNCQNGTLDLRSFALRPHSSADLITKMARVKFDHKAQCPRWEQFIIEVMCDDESTSAYLQKAMGYSLTGLTEYEVFFILYGATSRNGKTTLTETVAHILGDYAMTIQPQTLSRRSADGGAASPDIARLKGARLVNMPEPEKGLELNSALVKQLTGGDTYTGRHLRENPFEFTPEFKLFINTNHLPRASDDTVFASGRVKIIPFERHFQPDEQDTGLKQFFRRIENKSGILNWLIMGYRLMLEVGFDAPERVTAAIAEYREEADVIGGFLNEYTVENENGRIATTDLYAYYIEWAKANGYKQMSNRSFTIDIHRRFELRREGARGRVIIGLTLKK